MGRNLFKVVGLIQYEPQNFSTTPHSKEIGLQLSTYKDVQYEECEWALLSIQAKFEHN